MVHPAWHLDQHMDSDSGMGLLAFPEWHFRIFWMKPCPFVEVKKTKGPDSICYFKVK